MVNCLTLQEKESVFTIALSNSHDRSFSVKHSHLTHLDMFRFSCCFYFYLYSKFQVLTGVHEKLNMAYMVADFLEGGRFICKFLLSSTTIFLWL